MRRVAVFAAGSVFVSMLLVEPTGSVAGPPSSTVDPGVLVAGKVTAQFGTEQSAPVQGADVSVWWIPGMATAKPGDVLEIETVATTQTGPDGSYEIRLAPTAAMTRAASANGGWLNFDVGTVASDLGRSQSTGISRRVSKGGWQLADTDAQARVALEDPAAAPDLEAPGFSEAMATQADLVISDASPELSSPVDPQPSVVAQPMDEEVADYSGYCSFVVDATPQRYVSVVEFHNAANSNGKWTYGASADSDVEMGIQYSGSGDWSIGATRHISNSDGASVSMSYVGGDKANNYGRTAFEFVDGHYALIYGLGPQCYGTSATVGTKVKNPISWQGGVSTNTDAGSEYFGCTNSPQSTHRTSYPVGSTFTRESSSASQIGAAVDIGPISLGAKSGYSTSMDMHWDSKRGTGIWLCGTYSGVTTAGVIHAQNRP